VKAEEMESKQAESTEKINMLARLKEELEK